MYFRASVVLVIILFVSQICISKSSLTTMENSDGSCYCRTELTLNNPPCICTGMVEAVKEIVGLKSDIQKLHDKCSTVNTNIKRPYNMPSLILDGTRWTRFWWYTPISGWPDTEIDVLGVPYGACDVNASYCFGRLPGALDEADTELLAFDSAGTIYRWQFDPRNPTAHAAWNAFYHHRDQKVVNSQTWNPLVIAGPQPNAAQDSFMYRVQNGMRSLLLDDDNCDCYSSLSMGHGMCLTTFSTSYGSSGRFGVDLLYDSRCNTPDPKHGLSLYFRDDDDCVSDPCPKDQECLDQVNTYICA